MSFDALRTGAVIRYPYLWVREAGRGETEGRKARPSAVGVRLARANGEDVILLFPITSKAPERERFAIEIPETEKRRAGLDRDVRLWIVLDEFNEDIVGRSFYFEPEAPLGRFSKAFFLPVMKAFIARRAHARGVSRSG
ncbi:MAG: hypothetical protein ABSC22_13650 [Roseiarcus sp.]